MLKLSSVWERGCDERVWNAEIVASENGPDQVFMMRGSFEANVETGKPERRTKRNWMVGG